MRLFIKHFGNEKSTTNTKVIKAFGSMWKFLCLLKFCFIFKREGVNHSNFNLIQQIFIEHRFVDKYEYNLSTHPPLPPPKRLLFSRWMERCTTHYNTRTPKFLKGLQTGSLGVEGQSTSNWNWRLS